MSLGRYAYRRTIQPSSNVLIDHIWISEDLLASTFRRFANGQRRYESRVPGPMEARRRLAKRRNTAFAGIAGAGALDDVACLFGRNGREHMKWSDSQLGRATSETPNSDFYRSSSSSASPLPFYSENIDSSESFGQPHWQRGSGAPTDEVHREINLKEALRGCYTVAEVKDVIQNLGVDPQRDPAASRLIFEHLLSHSSEHELIVFLNDRSLNIPGAGNYLAAVKDLDFREAGLTELPILWDVVIRALELGLIQSDELTAIVEILPNQVGEESNDTGVLIALYQEMWDAIGKCGVYGHNDLDEVIADAWLEILVDSNTPDALLLAKQILGATHRRNLRICSWTPLLITQQLEASCREADSKFVNTLFRKFTGDTKLENIIQVTEFLVSSKKHDLLERWQGCLCASENTHKMISPQVWTDVRAIEDPASTSQISFHHQIILRLWVLRSLSNSLVGGPPWRPGTGWTDYVAYSLLNIYGATKKGVNLDDFMESMRKGIHDLGLPFNGLLMYIFDLKLGKKVTKAARKTLQRLEASDIPLGDSFADLQTYNAMKPHIFSAFERTVRQTDVTDPSFIKHMLHIVRNGNSRNTWTLIRLLRSHTPLKISLSKSYQPIPEPSEKALVRYYDQPRSSDCPDPHAALEMVHSLATSISCSRNLSPCRAYSLVHWLYVFLLKHGAPVRPVIARAMYHAGVVRYRREGLRVSPTQYTYIMEVVKKYEDPEFVEALVYTPQAGDMHEELGDLEENEYIYG
ncbi:uncharacterized protein KD926_004208 [Aspergillus affinis]|uniref:uncharacterized protein n=1 Tax=Aspergillus affinis TaxID=1070780 RepID=UPI0022FEAECE|nr:uncharacterized protein KD926_004208 [Aspergillus affinis]KAI9046368.1 hypothetical protein KD926_004208 [Aspergillus affinis]